MKRYKSTVLIVFAMLLAIGPGTAGAYPEKPITLVVARIRCGSDTVCRVVAASFKKYNLLPQPIVVENKVGGSPTVWPWPTLPAKKRPRTTSSAYDNPLRPSRRLQQNSPVNYKDFTPIRQPLV